MNNFKKMKKKSDKCNVSSSNRLVFISKEIQLDTDKSNSNVSNVEIIDLRHPRSNKKTKFMYDSNRGTIQEILQFSENNRSWFIGDSVSSDGSLYMSTSFDPLFLILPYLRKREQYRILDELIHDEEYADSAKLECLVDEDQLSQIATKKDVGEDIVWKYNEENTLNWLTEKVNRVVGVLKEKNIKVNTSCAVSYSFMKNVKQSDESYLRYAYGIVSEYLEEALGEKFSTHLNLPSLEEENALKRKNADCLDKEEIKKIKMECREKELLNAELARDAKTKQTTRKNPSHAALTKAAVGTKNISSFFKKK